MLVALSVLLGADADGGEEVLLPGVEGGSAGALPLGPKSVMALVTPTATLPIDLLVRLIVWPEPENLLSEDENV
ncbi:hypothetical protein [Streptomyces sp. NPDC000983]|uniref:hypothetical protein n=1 Tax=Streptomyces sp. NPDC000983 TaxID=3154373 RepID=UPI00331FD88C